MAVAPPQRMSLADVLLKEGIIDTDQHHRAIQEYDRTKRSLVRILTDMGVLSEDLRINILKRSCNCDVIRLIDVTPTAEVANYMTPDMCRKAQAVPIRIVDGSVMVAMEDPTDMRTIQDFEKLFGRSVKPMLAPSREIMDAIDRMPEDGRISREIMLVDEPKRGRLIGTLVLVASVFIPMMTFMFIISRTAVGQDWYSSFGFSTFENALVFLLVWGSWAAVAYFLVDLLFGKPAEE